MDLPIHFLVQNLKFIYIYNNKLLPLKFTSHILLSINVLLNYGIKCPPYDHPKKNVGC